MSPYKIQNQYDIIQCAIKKGCNIRCWFNRGDVISYATALFLQIPCANYHRNLHRTWEKHCFAIRCNQTAFTHTH